MRDVKLSIKPNKSLTYMLPFLDAQMSFQFRHLILNSYISFEESDVAFCILYDWTSDPVFLKYEGELMNHELFINHEDFGDKVVYKFKLSRNMMLGRNLFLKGEYKAFSQPHKDAIVNFLTRKNVGNLQKIKDILDVDSLVTSTPPDIDLETFKKHVSIIKHKTEDFKYEGS